MTFFDHWFIIAEETIKLIRQYGDICDIIHTDLHECLGHGSGQLLPGVDPDSLKDVYKRQVLSVKVVDF